MIHPTVSWPEVFASVADVYCIWGCSAIALAVLVRASLQCRPWKTALALASDERGASYALSYVLTFPFFLMLMCLIVQASLILMVKMGTVYAAYSAARTSVVWRPSEPLIARGPAADTRYDYALEKSRRAAAVAMTPFATGYRRHLVGLFPMGAVNPGAYADAAPYVALYRTLASRAGARDHNNHSPVLSRFDPQAAARVEYVATKFLYASAATRVELKRPIAAWNKPVEVSVTYTMPMHMPAVGRVFGSWWKPFFAREITTKATIPSESAETTSGRLNIPYDPKELVLR